MDQLSFLPTLEDERSLEALADVKIVYTDLDGTLLAPRGRLLCNYAGEPSAAVPEAIVGLREVGVELVIVTGRSRFQGNELIRVLDALAFIGEMGTVKQRRGASPIDIEYDTGTFAWDRARYATPYEAIEASGARDALFARFAGKLEMNYPRCLNRDVTHALRGYADVDEVIAFFRENGYELGFEDNGMLFMPSPTLVDCPEVRGYHIVPANTSKAIAVAKDMRERELGPGQAVAIGDGPGDIEMGDSTGKLIVMRNALVSHRNGALNERTVELAHEMAERWPDGTFITQGRCCDGWVEFARRLIEAKRLS